MIKVRAGLAAGGYVAGVVAANVLTASNGLWPVGFGLMATAGTVLAGASFVLRDAVQEVGGRQLALVALAVGCAVSALMATPTLAVASAAAFGLAELLDMIVYTKLREKGWLRAAAVSNLVGAIVDTFVFLMAAGFPVTALAVSGQLVGKGWATLAVVAPVLGARAWKWSRR
ncbi:MULTISPECIES: VUT family protein [unclassified Streptomyces]|uniref:VUT family protein n=1 Tax=unclassified Streptomyces TaxID=2593676 RepID=UPI00035EF6F4|nr:MULTISPECIES: VUT family protein [unclassified Streptomyces]MYY03079.1 VUT family protein [Streptomyces sp. SID4913]